MSLDIGIVGLPNVGKSTLFNALTHAGAAVAGYPFTTIEPNVGVVPVPDPRLEELRAIVQPERVVPTTLRVVDIAGLVRGASQGEGLGNQFLGHIRTVDAVAMVVRGFEDADVPHVTPELDPAADIETVDLELILADLATVERHLEKVRGQAKGSKGAYDAEIAALEGLEQRLGQGQPAAGASLPEAEAGAARELELLSAKPRLYVVNVGDGSLPDGGRYAMAVRAIAAAQGAEVVVLSAAMEADLADWPADEAAAYRAELGLPEPGLIAFIHAGYRLLDLITFFTTTGGKEVRAWTLRRGATALDAAATIHSDMARGFIRAEVMQVADLVAAGSAAALRERGQVRVEGRDYVVQDGDILHIRFNV
ncbi:MAG TPA: redox-regulated ATPase YchF [Anaerolineae bacterium]|nr:redox-regulated ATPase YchF [Anaerolineae bacterium]HOR00243.1 redox-regulated ATPase YchF [Anaerolineae bacterium]HPL27759.1 redox-regulated ATPase YchF [Anaerolineae bacterium]